MKCFKHIYGFCLLVKHVKNLLHLLGCSGASGESAEASAPSSAPSSAKELQEEEWKTELARVCTLSFFHLR